VLWSFSLEPLGPRPALSIPELPVSTNSGGCSGSMKSTRESPALTNSSLRSNSAAHTLHYLSELRVIAGAGNVRCRVAFRSRIEAYRRVGELRRGGSLAALYLPLNRPEKTSSQETRQISRASRYSRGCDRAAAQSRDAFARDCAEAPILPC
jgi:hypothetical protein